MRNTFEDFIEREARAALRAVATIRALVKRDDATTKDKDAFIRACQEANAVRAIMEDADLGPRYATIAAEVDAEEQQP